MIYIYIYISLHVLQIHLSRWKYICRTGCRQLSGEVGVRFWNCGDVSIALDESCIDYGGFKNAVSVLRKLTPEALPSPGRVKNRPTRVFQMRIANGG